MKIIIYSILIFYFFSNCVMLDVVNSRQLLEKKLISTREIETVEEEITVLKGKKLTSDSLLLPIKRVKLTKKIKETNYDSKYLVESTLSDSFYVIGGVIPFVVQEKGWDTYFTYALVSFAWSFPVIILDWASLPFRTGKQEEIKQEIESTVLKETRSELSNNSKAKIKVYKEYVLYKNGELTIPFSELFGDWNPQYDIFEPYYIRNHVLQIEIEDELKTVKKFQMSEILKQEEFHKVILADAMKRPESHKNILSYLVFANEEPAVFDSFISAGFKIDYKDKRIGQTPLETACRWGNMKLIKYLIDKGADVNYVGEAEEDSSNETPIYSAIYGGKLEAVKYLAEHGADLKHKNHRRNTPLDEAENYYQKEIIEYLKSSGR